MRALPILALATAIGACPYARAAEKPAPKPAAKPAAKAEKIPKKAVCAICAVKEGSKTPEEVKGHLKYKGKMYYFCNVNEKAEFISNPAKYAKVGK